MTSVGETLRRERLQRKLDLDQVTHELKISRRMLDAIEADKYDQLPGSIFAKAFVRQYAALLGLDGDALAAQVQRSIEPLSIESAERAKPAVTPIEVPRVEEWKSVGDKGFRLSGSLPAAVLVVVVMLICSAVYAWIQRPRSAPPAQASVAQANPPQPVRSEPAPQQTPAAPVETAQTPPPPQAENPATQPATQAVTPAAGAETGTAAPATPGPVHVEIVAEEAVWVLARVDGKFAFSDTLAANTKRTLDGTNEVTLRLGNAGGVSILLNGKAIGPAGPKGQVRNLQFTSGGFQIVSPKPAVAAPLDPLDR
jgi:cytoskeleton protein RodZ